VSGEGVEASLAAEGQATQTADMELLAQRDGEQVGHPIVEVVDLVRADGLSKQRVLGGHAARLQHPHYLFEHAAALERARKVVLHRLHRRLELRVRLEEIFVRNVSILHRRKEKQDRTENTEKRTARECTVQYVQVEKEQHSAYRLHLLQCFLGGRLERRFHGHLIVATSLQGLLSNIFRRHFSVTGIPAHHSIRTGIVRRTTRTTGHTGRRVDRRNLRIARYRAGTAIIWKTIICDKAAAIHPSTDQTAGKSNQEVVALEQCSNSNYCMQ
jgi:hypothetical protein